MNKIKSMFIFFVVLYGVAVVPSDAMDLSLVDATNMIVSESHDLKKADAFPLRMHPLGFYSVSTG